MDVTEIEKRVDRAVAAPIEVNAELGGLNLETLGQVMEFAKLMSVAGAAVPKYLRGNPGACLAICSRALRWQMDPFAVAEKSYMVSNRGEDRVAFEAQLVHAVITARAPLRERLRYEIVGEGDERRCKVWGTFKGEKEPHVFVSETLTKLREARGRNDDGKLKGSPLWETQPEVQMAYAAVRQWARLFASETLLGVYTPDEIEDGAVLPAPAVSTLGDRLRQAKLDAAARGFDAASVGAVIEGELNTGGQHASAEGSGSASDHQGRSGADSAGGSDAAGQAGRASPGPDADPAGREPAGEVAAPAQGEEPAPGKAKKGKR
jgi:hypothetical protein